MVAKIISPFFETARLAARRFGEEDIPAFAAIRGNPDVARFQDWQSFDEADARAFIGLQTGRNPGESGWFQFAIERREDHRLIGDCGLKISPDDHRLAQIGYTIGKPHWNRGYATELISALIAYVFAAFPVHRIAATVDPRNHASIRVLEKAGLTKEAHLRKAIWFKGEWADDAIYAVLRESEVRDATGL
jgi:RimJ/RimL family protein N-acetyltransferase